MNCFYCQKSTDHIHHGYYMCGNCNVEYWKEKEHLHIKFIRKINNIPFALNLYPLENEMVLISSNAVELLKFNNILNNINPQNVVEKIKLILCFQ